MGQRVIFSQYIGDTDIARFLVRQLRVAVVVAGIDGA